VLRPNRQRELLDPFDLPGIEVHVEVAGGRSIGPRRRRRLRVEPGEVQVYTWHRGAVVEGRQGGHMGDLAEEVGVPVRAEVELVGGLADLAHGHPDARHPLRADIQVELVARPWQVDERHIGIEDAARVGDDGHAQDRRVGGSVLDQEAELDG